MVAFSDVSASGAGVACATVTGAFDCGTVDFSGDAGVAAVVVELAANGAEFVVEVVVLDIGETLAEFVAADEFETAFAFVVETADGALAGALLLSVEVRLVEKETSELLAPGRFFKIK